MCFNFKPCDYTNVKIASKKKKKNECEDSDVIMMLVNYTIVTNLYMIFITPFVLFVMFTVRRSRYFEKG